MVISYLSNLLGFPQDQLRFFISMVLTYPLGYVNFYIKNPTLRLIYGLVPGLMLQYFMYGSSMIHLIVITIMTYIFIAFFGRKISAFYILIYSMLHLTSVHLKRMVDDFAGWEIDVSTILMMSICKFSSIAFSYEDGMKEDSVLKNSYHRSKKIVDKPTLLEVFSYIFFYPSCIVGPSFEFSDFRKFINQEAEYKDLDKEIAVKSAMKEFLKAFICIIIFQVGKSFYDLKYLISDEFSNHNYFFKFLLFNFVMGTLRAKYYIGWKMGQSAVNFCGLSYNPQTTKTGEITIIEHKFDKIDSCGVTEVETHINPKVKMQYWNRTVHFWLKYNVCLRIINIKHPLFKDNMKVAAMVTFILSAFWHGLYPSYYISFFFFYFVEQTCEGLEKKFNFFEKLSKLPLPLLLVAHFLMLSVPNYLGLVFSYLIVGESYTFQKNMYFIPNLIYIFSYIYVIFVAKGEKKKKDVNETINTTPSSNERKLE